MKFRSEGSSSDLVSDGHDSVDAVRRRHSLRGDHDEPRAASGSEETRLSGEGVK
jgi:hypothetical protein